MITVDYTADRHRKDSGPVPFGMPDLMASTVMDVRDALYLAAHDSVWVGLGIEPLRELLTVCADTHQMMILRRGELPAGFVLWGRLDEEAEARYLAGGITAMNPPDLVSGDRVWLLGIAAPWKREDFAAMLAWAGKSLCEGKGGWRLSLPATGVLPARIMEFETRAKGGTLKEVA